MDNKERIKKIIEEDISDLELALNRYITNGNISHLQTAYQKLSELRQEVGEEIKELKKKKERELS